MKKIMTVVAAVLATLSLSATVYTPDPGQDAIYAIFDFGLEDGDIIVLSDGAYYEQIPMTFTTKVTFIAATNATPELHWSSISIKNDFEVNGIKMVNNSKSNYLLRTGGNVTGKIAFKNCSFQLNSAYTDATPYIYLSSNTVGELEIDNCIIKPNPKDGGAIVSAGSATIGTFTMTNCTAESAGNKAVYCENATNIYVDHCTFYNCGQCPISLKGNTMTSYVVQNCIFSAPNAIDNSCVATYAGEVKNCVYYNYLAPLSTNVSISNCANKDPLFKDAANGDFKLKNGSPAIGSATDKSNLGDPRWGAELACKEIVENKTICYGESVSWRGQDCNETKAYYDTLRYDGTQCDSVHFTLNLKVTAEAIENIENKTICYGESVSWRGRDCNETKAYHDTLRYKGSQCDSVHFTFNLKVTAECKEIVENKTIGYGESVSWRGQDCNETKAYHDTLRYDGTQCDSVHFTFNLTVLPKAYTRNVTNGKYGTICLAKAFSAADGVEGLYKPATQATDSSVLYCTEVQLSEVVAGESYIFKADSDAVVFTLAGTTIADPVVANNMLGNLGDTITVDANFIAEHSGYAILGIPQGASEQQVVKLVEDSKLLPNCAMINLKTVPATGAPQAAPGRRMITFDRNVATGVEQVAGGRLQVAEKCMVNGQLIIIRDGKMFNAQGQEL